MASVQRSTTPQQRVIRVFVSSTFRDMQAERDELVKRIFPQLRKLCEQRGVTWGEVDLRWGITDEEKAEGKVLPICLAEIQKCRPYFIGLLGERYGSLPAEIPPELFEREPWLNEHLEHSITELEILHGVLNNPDMAEHAFFYLRSPSYINSLPLEEQARYREYPTPEETKQYGKEGAERRAEERRRKLEALKRKINSSGFPVRKDYRDPIQLGELVLQDLTEVIDRRYPEESVPDPLDREAAEHEAFAESRYSIYVGRREYFERLYRHVQGDGQPLVVLGESGGGKSALLANWATQFRKQNPGEFLLMHFIGASSHSTDWALMLRRIMGEFKRRFDIKDDIPDRPDVLRSAFANWLNMAAAKGRVILIIDGLNQLEDRDSAPDLVWLPPQIPANVRLILSTLPGRPLDDLSKRGWPTMMVEPLEPQERKQLVEEYLGQYTKELSLEMVESIIVAPQMANPLYLRALLEELRIYGDHDTLRHKIDEYLAAPTVVSLYEKILSRYEQDYERERPGLVRDAMRFLWGARRGLSEVELMEMLGSDGQPLPGAHWSPLYLAAEQALVSRSGLIGFSHDYFRQAVRLKYLPSEQKEKEIHLCLANYFEGCDLNPRKVDELPWQLFRAKEWQRLFDLLSFLPFFNAAWKANQFEVKSFWSQVEENCGLHLVDAYRRVIDMPSQASADYIWEVAALLHDTGYRIEGLKIREYLVKYYRELGNVNELQNSLGNQAGTLRALGDLDGAMVLLKEQERICHEIGSKAELGISLGNQASILYDRGDLDGAMVLYKEAERIFREQGNRQMLQVVLGNRAVILADRGELDSAMVLHKEEERIYRESGNKDGLTRTLGNQAYILYTRGDLDGAMVLHKKEEQICRELGNKDGLATSLGNQAIILKARGDLDGAMALQKEKERICREIGNRARLATSLGNQANILASRGDPDGAIRLHKEEEQICRELNNRDGLAISLGNQALILRDRGDPDGAMALFKEEEQICREINNMDRLQASLGSQAAILCNLGDLDSAMKLFKEQERICDELGKNECIAMSLTNQAVILHGLKRGKEALALAEQAYELALLYGSKDLQQHVKNMLKSIG